VLSTCSSIAALLLPGKAAASAHNQLVWHGYTGLVRKVNRSSRMAFAAIGPLPIQ
jgi:hypothetical protein